MIYLWPLCVLTMYYSATSSRQVSVCVCVIETVRHAWVRVMYVLWVCSAGLAPHALMTTSPTPGGLSSAFKPMETASRCLISSLGDINSIGMCGCCAIWLSACVSDVLWCASTWERSRSFIPLLNIRQWLVSVLYSYWLSDSSTTDCLIHQQFQVQSGSAKLQHLLTCHRGATNPFI